LFVFVIQITGQGFLLHMCTTLLPGSAYFECYFFQESIKILVQIFCEWSDSLPPICDRRCLHR